MIPVGCNACFFVDSMYAAERVQKALKIGEGWIKERPIGFVLKRIVKLVGKMKEYWRFHLIFEPVYSCIVENLNKAAKENNEALIRRINKWKDRAIWRYGSWEWSSTGE